MDPNPAGPAVATADVVRAAARAFERDRYLAALLAPRGVRGDLIAIAAFAGEVARTSGYVSEAMIGEIRLLWWRDAVARIGSSGGEVTGNPIADALGRAVRRFELPIRLLNDVIDAESAHVADSVPFVDWGALMANLSATHASLFELACRVLVRDRATDVPLDLIVHAGKAYGLARTLVEMPAVLSQGRIRLPADRLDAHRLDVRALRAGEGAAGLAAVSSEAAGHAREHLEIVRNLWRGLSEPERVALAPVALVRPYLSACQMHMGRLREIVDIAPLTRVWRIWRAARLGWA
ncbi:MAG: squalene/phytoene synthase family protein [Hyphomicrobiaceae bacterium]